MMDEDSSSSSIVSSSSAVSNPNDEHAYYSNLSLLSESSDFTIVKNTQDNLFRKKSKFIELDQFSCDENSENNLSVIANTDLDSVKVPNASENEYPKEF